MSSEGGFWPWFRDHWRELALIVGLPVAGAGGFVGGASETDYAQSESQLEACRDSHDDLRDLHRMCIAELTRVAPHQGRVFLRGGEAMEAMPEVAAPPPE